VLFQDRRNTGAHGSGSDRDGHARDSTPGGCRRVEPLLQFPAPRGEGRTLACPCGQQAHYREQRSKPVLTAVGLVEVLRPYYLCVHCGVGQFPADVELDIENTEFSPGVRACSVVGQEAPFDRLVALKR